LKQPQKIDKIRLEKTESAQVIEFFGSQAQAA